ncbi:unnamed protein product [Psylliodes chrysocephalus]|uniref:Uncharacterized protein n=1 Tax=Psylliodes chrysocephalus TaxID=3402493 RepID=A0A9P0GHB8_9CUCU|nr:unnamed protein product [Psylliodes chrysocephala]
MNNHPLARDKEKRLWLFISMVKDQVTENMVITHLEKKCDRKDLLSVKEVRTYKKTANNKCFKIRMQYDPMIRRTLEVSGHVGWQSTSTTLENKKIDIKTTRKQTY